MPSLLPRSALTGLLALSLLVAAPGLPAVAQNPTSTVAPFNTARAYQDIAVLAEDIGVRVAGTPAEAAAIEYIAGEFAAAGYAVEIMPFEFADLFAPEAIFAESYEDLPVNVSANVIARAHPGDYCAIIVGGHHDTVRDSPGAVDNASGVAVVLETARAFAADGPDDGVCFATFGAEESGLNGSRIWVEQLERADALPRAMVNLDLAGLGVGVQAIGSRSLTVPAVGLGEQLGIQTVFSAIPGGASSDHQSFLDAGVPSIIFTNGLYPEIHAPEDVLALVDPDAVELFGRQTVAMVAWLEATIGAPAGRLSGK